VHNIVDGITTILVVAIIFGSIASLFVVPRLLKSRERYQTQQTIRAAIDKGQPLPPEVLDAMTRDVRPVATARHDIRVGIIWLAVAGGIAGAGYFADNEFSQHTGFDHVHVAGMLSGASIPAVIGLAFIVLSFFNKNRA
jgi:hypothetical protein